MGVEYNVKGVEYNVKRVEYNVKGVEYNVKRVEIVSKELKTKTQSITSWIPLSCFPCSLQCEYIS